MLGLVDPVSVYCDWVRCKVWSAASISVRQPVKLRRSVLEIHSHVAETLSNQQTNKLQSLSFADIASLLHIDLCIYIRHCGFKKKKKRAVSLLIPPHPPQNHLSLPTSTFSLTPPHFPTSTVVKDEQCRWGAPGLVALPALHSYWTDRQARARRHARTHSLKHIQTHTHKHTHTHTHTHTHPYIYMYTHTHTSHPTPALRPLSSMLVYNSVAQTHSHVLAITHINTHTLSLSLSLSHTHTARKY